MLLPLILLTRKCHNIIKHSFNENIKELHYLLISYWNWNVLHFPHSAFSTLRSFHTPHFPHSHFPPSTFSTPCTLHSVFSTEPEICATNSAKLSPPYHLSVIGSPRHKLKAEQISVRSWVSAKSWSTFLWPFFHDYRRKQPWVWEMKALRSSHHITQVHDDKP